MYSNRDVDGRMAAIGLSRLTLSVGLVGVNQLACASRRSHSSSQESFGKLYAPEQKSLFMVSETCMPERTKEDVSWTKIVRLANRKGAPLSSFLFNLSKIYIRAVSLMLGIYSLNFQGIQTGFVFLIFGAIPSLALCREATERSEGWESTFPNASSRVFSNSAREVFATLSGFPVAGHPPLARGGARRVSRDTGSRLRDRSAVYAPPFFPSPFERRGWLGKVLGGMREPPSSFASPRGCWKRKRRHFFRCQTVSGNSRAPFEREQVPSPARFRLARGANGL
ncbi:hypothetical protein SCHPADRAFT_892607 [Schizopora paradoxa]|uniref:Uncharacterized protein n=1 Tax=Schizopora paradoxa TaxID=27342 RepID=A0A0H2REU8_9AGAM|nr:hypothetical protein SCHPADRAFT_892607 [Schizopora paradoxa]